MNECTRMLAWQKAPQYLLWPVAAVVSAGRPKLTDTDTVLLVCSQKAKIQNKHKNTSEIQCEESLAAGPDS